MKTKLFSYNVRYYLPFHRVDIYTDGAKATMGKIGALAEADEGSLCFPLSHLQLKKIQVHLKMSLIKQ